MTQLTLFRKITLWTVALLVAGCAGITPYDPPNYRDEPLGNGLLSGADGEFVIYGKETEAKTETNSEASKNKGQKMP